MNYDDFTQARRDASAFIQQNNTEGVAYDAIVTMCFVHNALSQVRSSSVGAVHGGITTTTTAPDWFVNGLSQFAGKKLTSSAILSALGRPTGIAELREAGGWLRQIVGEPKRSNGQTVFLIALRGKPAAVEDSPMGDSEDNLFHTSIPIASRVLNYAALNDGKVTCEQVAMAIGAEASNDNLKEIWKALNKCGRSQGDRSFILGER